MNIEDLLYRTDNLIVLPEIAIRLQEILDDDRSSIHDLAEVVSVDPILTSKLLKLANSALYNFNARIDTIPRAINVIGSDAVYSLALANSAVEAFNRIPSNVIDLEHFWRLSVDCALVTKQLGRAISYPFSDRLFVTGLLSKLGELVCVAEIPDVARQISAAADPEEAEAKQQQLLGFSYSQLTMELMKQWRFPVEIYSVVGHLRDPASCRFAKEASLLSIAERASLAINLETVGNLVDVISEEELQLNGLTREDLTNAIDYANLEAINVLSILSPHAMSIY